MDTAMIRHRRDGSVLALIHLFGLSYFTLFLPYFFIYHFPQSLNLIVNTQAVAFHSVGVMLWCSFGVFYQTLTTIRPGQASSWQRLEWGAAFVLMYTTAVPFILVRFSEYPPLQIFYISAFTAVGVRSGVEVFNMKEGSESNERFLDSISFGLVTLAPAIHLFSQYPHDLSLLDTGLIQHVLISAMGMVCGVIQLPERLGMVGSWSPSLYTMHLTLVLSGICYSKCLLDATG